MAGANPLRFSSKYQDEETYLLYFGCRYYDASTGRWASRDPEEDYEHSPAYAYVNNDTLKSVDFIGLRRLNWDVASAQQRIKETIVAWSDKGWTLAAAFLKHFYFKQGSAPYVLNESEVNKVKRDALLRLILPEYIKSDVSWESASGGKYEGATFKFRWQPWDGEMFRAFGGARIRLEGCLVWQSGSWRWRGTVEIHDTYVWLPNGDVVGGVHWPGWEGDTYRAAYYLQSLPNSPYKSFETKGEWEDAFSGTQ